MVELEGGFFRGEEGSVVVTDRLRIVEGGVILD